MLLGIHPPPRFSQIFPFYPWNIERCEIYSLSVYCISIQQQRRHKINKISLTFTLFLSLSIYEHVIKNNNKTTSFLRLVWCLYFKHEDRPIITARHSDAFKLISSLNVSLIAKSVHTAHRNQSRLERWTLEEHFDHSWILKRYIYEKVEHGRICRNIICLWHAAFINF